MATKEFFPDLGKIPFEGTSSKNPLAFHYYEPERIVHGKKMKDWLRFSMAWWHTLGADGSDQFGTGTKKFPWNEGATALERAKSKMDAGFEIMQKLGFGYYCFHDVDLIEEGDSIEEYERNMKEIVAYAKQKQAETGIKLLWGTANVFGHPRYMNGAATNPDFPTAARAMLQIKNAIDATIELGGENYVFWGGREGYMSLLNTDMKREKSHLATMLKKISFDINKKGILPLEAQIREESSSFTDFKADNVFFYAQGKAYGYYLMLQSLAHDYKDIIVSHDLYPLWTQMLSSLETAATIRPLLVRNGELDDTFAPNHLSYLSFYMLKAQKTMLTIADKLSEQPLPVKDAK